MAQDQLIPLPWPTQGFVENTSLTGQPAGTTTDALNVRNYDALDRRLRGGQRTGLEKYLADAVNGSNSIQAINQSILAFDSNLVIADTVLSPDPSDTTKTESIDYSDGTLQTVSSSRWTTYEPTTINNENFMFGAAVNDSESVSVESNEISAPSAASLDFRCAALTSQATLGTAYILKYVIEFDAHATASADARICWRMLDDPVNAGDSNRFSGYHLEIHRDAGAGTVDIDATLRLTIPGVGTSTEVTANAVTTTSASTFTATVEVIVNGNTLNVLINNISAVTNYTMASLSSQTNTGFALDQPRTAIGNPSARITEITYFTGLLPASRRTTKLVVVSGGSVYSGNKNGLDIAGSGSGIFSTSNEVALQPAFQKVYMSDGLTYKILDAATNTVSDWQSSMVDGALPVGGNGTTYAITAVSAGAGGTFTVAEDVSSIIQTGDAIEVKSSTGNNNTYTIASTSGSGPTVLTVDQTIRDSTVDGVLALGNVTCTILGLYRGAIILSGLETDPHNIFKLRNGDPLDANYFPTVTSNTQPVAANFNKTFGILGDVVTAWATYSDDMAIIGMANSLAVLRGDPAAGGQIDNITDKIGIVGSEAWTFDTGNTFYFMGINGFYRMNLGTFQPELLSQGRLDKTFSDIDTAAKRVQLIYDPKWQGVHILIKSQQEQTTTPDRHYFWDERNDAFWPDEYPLAHGPRTAFRFTADDPEQNAVLFGGWDSVIRAFGDTATTDDGTLISSHCRFTPILQGNILASSRIHDITIITDAQSDNLDFKLYVGDTVEAAEANADAGNARIKRTLSGGRNSPIRQRVSQNTIIAELSQAGVNGAGATWAFEAAMARIGVMNRVRGRGV